jgi:hypothetical protein
MDKGLLVVSENGEGRRYQNLRDEAHRMRAWNQSCQPDPYENLTLYEGHFSVLEQQLIISKVFNATTRAAAREDYGESQSLCYFDVL